MASTMQITSAMKMVSAAKLKKAQDAIVQFRPYAEKLQEILASVGDSMKDDEDNLYAEQRDKERILLVLITSNRGLCGAFNSNAIICPSKTVSALVIVALMALELKAPHRPLLEVIRTSKIRSLSR